MERGLTVSLVGCENNCEAIFSLELIVVKFAEMNQNIVSNYIRIKINILKSNCECPSNKAGYRDLREY
jgi:hypothetical protein